MWRRSSGCFAPTQSSADCSSVHWSLVGLSPSSAVVRTADQVPAAVKSYGRRLDVLVGLVIGTSGYAGIHERRILSPCSHRDRLRLWDRSGDRGSSGESRP